MCQIKNQLNKENGSALIMVLLFTTIIGILGTSLLYVLFTHHQNVLKEELKMQAYYAAEAGIARGIDLIGLFAGQEEDEVDGEKNNNGNGNENGNGNGKKIGLKNRDTISEFPLTDTILSEDKIKLEFQVVQDGEHLISTGTATNGNLVYSTKITVEFDFTATNGNHYGWYKWLDEIDKQKKEKDKDKENIQDEGNDNGNHNGWNKGYKVKGLSIISWKVD
ncbi:MAG: hypothetical protein ACH0QD_09865 [Tepidibacillus sp.]